MRVHLRLSGGGRGGVSEGPLEAVSGGGGGGSE